MNSLREKTLAQAVLIEFASAQDGITASPAYQVLSAVVNRARGMEEQQLRILRATTPARELDAEKGGEFPAARIGLDTIAALHARAAPPAQAAEAVGRVAIAIYTENWLEGTHPWDSLRQVAQNGYRRMARAAIAAMQAGEA